MTVHDVVGPHIPRIRRNIISLDTVVTTLNENTYSSVIVINEADIHDSTHLYLDYFAPNIGLVKRDSISYLDSSTTEILTLQEFHINN